MLRSLDPITGQPKSKKFVPTAEERKNFSPNELAGIDKELEDDRKLRIDRAVKNKLENAIREQVLDEMEGKDAKGK